MLDFRHLSQIILKQQQGLVGLVSVKARRQLNIHLNRAFVGTRHVFRANYTERYQRHRHREGCQHSQHQLLRLFDAFAQQNIIFCDCLRLKGIQPAPQLALRLLHAVFIKARSQHRRQRKGYDKRHQRSKNNRHAKLLEKLSCRTLHKGNRQKYHHIAKRHSDCRHTNLITSFLRCYVGAFAHRQKAMDILQHNNGVIDKNTDTQCHTHK